jgi:Protein of unknown function (DUF3292)
VVPGGLDLNIADEDEFSPDKLRSTIERLYMTVVGPKIDLSKVGLVYRTRWACKARCSFEILE